MATVAGGPYPWVALVAAGLVAAGIGLRTGRAGPWWVGGLAVALGLGGLVFQGLGAVGLLAAALAALLALGWARGWIGASG